MAVVVMAIASENQLLCLKCRVHSRPWLAVEMVLSFHGCCQGDSQL